MVKYKNARGILMDLKSFISIVPDFPKEGISFKDITTLLQNGDALKYAVDQFAHMAKDLQIDIILGPEARGFIFGTAVAYALGAGFVPLRKAGKLPRETISESYSLEYGKDSLEIHHDAIQKGQRVLIVDDLLATGGTLSTSIKLVEKLQGTVEGVFTLIELMDLNGRENLKGYNVQSLITYPY